MDNAWFAPQGAYWFSAVAVVSLSALAAPLILRGARRALVLSVWGAIIAAGGVMLGLGALAWAAGQPPTVVRPLTLTGAALALSYAASLAFVLRAYRAQERRKVAAHEL